MRPGYLLSLLLLALATAAPAQDTASDPAAALLPPESLRIVLDASPPVAVSPPLVALAGIGAEIGIEALEALPAEEVRVVVRDDSGEVVGEAVLVGGAPGSVEVVIGGGRHSLSLHLPDHYAAPVEFTLRAVPGWLTVVPPLLAIALALAFRQVVPALLAGIWAGAWIGYGGVLVGFLRTLDRFLIDALVDRDHMFIMVFSMLLGGMVGIVSRSGGTAGLVEVVAPRATDSRRGQFFTWLLGLLIFFDDYTNTLVVGNTMRPITDRLKVSREKLAYIVDSTAAPVASLALVSTWIGFQVSLIGDSLADLGSQEDPYWIFVQSIPYCFYPILALAFVLMVALSGRDFGPMLRAERRAATGRLVAADSAPLSDFDHSSLRPEEGKPRRWYNAVVPVVVVLNVTFVSQYLTGRAALVIDGDPLGETGFFSLGFRGLGTVFSAGDSFRALLYGAACGCLVAILLAWFQRILKIEDSLRAWVGGMKSMFLAFVILALAWGIGDVCRALGTDDYIVSLLSGRLDPRWLPLLIFIIAAAVAFSTGTSWSTMSILIPLAVPSAYALGAAAGYDVAGMHHILLGAVSSVLAGAIFGVMSSMASGCDHVDHVKTQLPYAFLVAGAAMLLGSIPSGFGLSPWIPIVLGLVVLAAALRFLGRRVDTA